MFNEYMAENFYTVVADYEKYVELQKQNGENAVSFIKYALGNF